MFRQLKQDFWLCMLVIGQILIVSGLMLFATFNLRGCL